ncbi:MAG TPA: MoaD/ThiS family protein [Chitinophagaceae bacterium]|nr:MoaD/ThiS family protein [Chitinophagaceae bacterium]
MPNVKFTYALKRFFPGIKGVSAEGKSFREIFAELETHYPGISSYILDEQGSLRKHVNIFIDGKMIHDRKTLSDPFTPGSDIYIMQALSGG